MSAFAILNASRRFAFVAIAGLVISASAAAQNLGTAFTDLWWNPAESGWGVTIDHQQNFMFMTFYIYRADGSPYWVTATLQKVGTAGLATFPQVFSGTVYENHGPYFAGSYSPPATANPVGTITFSASNGFSATIDYSVNGVTVTKQVERLTLQTVNYSGTYLGGAAYVTRSCATPSNNGTTVPLLGPLTIAQSGNSIELTAQDSQHSCTFTGTYSQQGSLGYANGDYSCTDGSSGTFSLYAVQWTIFGMSAGITGRNQKCAFDGILGGVTGLHLQQ